MRLDPDECWARLASAQHGVLATVHAERGVDAVPVVFAVTDDRRIVVPIDTVKPKRPGVRLQRLRNLDHDARCVLLVDSYDDDWSRLWWVRVHGRGVEAEPTDQTRALLARRHPQYGAPESVASTIVVTPDAVTGWRSSPGA